MANPGQDGDEHNDPTKNPNHEVREKQRTSTTRVLQALEYPTMADEQAQASLETMRQAEEGTICGNCNRTTSVLDIANEPEPRVNSGVALSTVAFMSEVHSAVRHVYSPSERGSSPGKSTPLEPHDI
jgi:hypothetical protein